jgi:sialic acid synthase SpsE
MGSSEKKVFKCEQETRKYDKRSCVSKTMIHKGQTLKQSHIAYKRPGTGVWPSMEGQIIGKKAIIDIPADNVLQFSMFK